MPNNKHKASKTSKLSKTLAPHFDALPPDEFSERSCGAECSCTLKAGIEHLFVYLTAHAFLERTKKVPPCQFLYTPHSTAEMGGFDLSLGHFTSLRRVLLMHKLMRHQWCDGAWIWRSSKDGKAHGQIITLLNNYLIEKRRHLPFLALHVCYCLHEYRRMGIKEAGVQVPDFSDPLRSIFVNLVPLLKRSDWGVLLDTKDAEIQIQHKQGDPTVDVAFVSCVDGTTLQKLAGIDLPRFLDATKHLKL